MATRVILTAMGSDRPGLTRALADAILSAGGNWLESHLSRLGGKYVGSVLVEIEESAVARLEAEVRAIDAAALDVNLVPAGEEPGAGRSLAFELVGQDRPGIVREVTSVLSGLDVNIDSFETTVDNGAWSGERLFRATARVSLPENLDPSTVQAALEEISGEIMVDFTFENP